MNSRMAYRRRCQGPRSRQPLRPEQAASRRPGFGLGLHAVLTLEQVQRWPHLRQEAVGALAEGRRRCRRRASESMPHQRRGMLGLRLRAAGRYEAGRSAGAGRAPQQLGCMRGGQSIRRGARGRFRCSLPESGTACQALLISSPQRPERSPLPVEPRPRPAAHALLEQRRGAPSSAPSPSTMSKPTLLTVGFAQRMPAPAAGTEESPGTKSSCAQEAHTVAVWGTASSAGEPLASSNCVGAWQGQRDGFAAPAVPQRRCGSMPGGATPWCVPALPPALPSMVHPSLQRRRELLLSLCGEPGAVHHRDAGVCRTQRAAKDGRRRGRGPRAGGLQRREDLLCLAQRQLADLRWRVQAAWASRLHGCLGARVWRPRAAAFAAAAWWLADGAYLQVASKNARGCAHLGAHQVCGGLQQAQRLGRTVVVAHH